MNFIRSLNGSLIASVVNSDMAYFMDDGDSKLLSSAGQKTQRAPQIGEAMSLDNRGTHLASNSQIGASFQNWYNGLRKVKQRAF